jgi:3-phenylpropionate/trans-cinnamate dioxygenase ferredoxin subunit
MGRKLQGYRRWAAARLDELPPGSQKIVEIDGRSIGLFNVKGHYRAVLNVCPHELAPVCRGYVRGTTLPSPPGEFRWGREGEILACPWHQWEFDLLTGACLVDKRHLHLFPVEIEDEMIYVLLRAGRQGGA